MFNYIKTLIKRANNYSRTQVMLDIFKVNHHFYMILGDLKIIEEIQ